MTTNHARSGTSEIFIGILAILSIILVLVEFTIPVSNSSLIWIYAIDFVVCTIFAVDFIQRMKSSENKGQFFKSNGYEVLAMIPAVFLYFMGTLPIFSIVFRSLRFVRVIRVILLLARMGRFINRASTFIQQSRLGIMAVITTSVVLIGAFSALILDSGTANPKITNLSDAIWWSISTVTTVGYGDIVPSSQGARIMGMLLMVVGIGVMAAFISLVSATLVESRLKQANKKTASGNEIVAEITETLNNSETISDDDAETIVSLIRSHQRKR